MIESPLRPDPQTLGQDWNRIVLEEYEQVERLREWRDEDYYRPIAQHFARDPHREDDPVLERLREISRPDATWLDIGAGGGRYTLPLALVNEQVTAVDPSRAMLDVLRDGLKQFNIRNVTVVEGRWPDNPAELRADFSLLSHVGYDLREINPFLDAVENATRERCVALLMDRAPSGGFVRLWEQVHGEPRQQLPAMREFLTLLLARGASPEVEIFTFPQRERDEEELRTSARRRLWLLEGSEKDKRLQEILTSEIKAGVENYQRPRLVAHATWTPVRST